MKNRSRADLVASILQVICRGGSTKTKIMYRAYLSYNQLNEYLLFMLEAGLVQHQNGKQGLLSSYFVITEKGRRFLDIYDKINEMVTMVQSR